MTSVSVSLAPLDSTDMAWCRQNRNDYDVWRWCRQVGPISDKEQFEWFERQHKDPTIRMMKVVATTEGKAAPVGVVGLTSIDMINRRAEFSAWISPVVQGRGLGKHALQLLLDFGFSHLGLNLIWGETFAGNPAALMFVKVGLKPDGTRRQFYFREGKFIDATLFSLTAEEFYAARARDHQHAGDPGDSDPALRRHPKRRTIRKAASAKDQPRAAAGEEEAGGVQRGGAVADGAEGAR